MTPDMIALSVRSLVRLGAAARAAYEQAARNAPIKLNDLVLPEIDDDDALFDFFEVEDEQHQHNPPRLGPGGDLAPLWIETDDGMRPRDNAARQALIAEQMRIIEQRPQFGEGNWVAERFAQQGRSSALVSQWATGHGPPTPAARLVLAFADVTLDFVGANPSILGVGGSGEKLIAALSRNFRDLLPNVDDKNAWQGKEAKYFFVERALAITLHAGLKTLNDNTGLIVEQERYRTLLGNVLQPFVKQLDDRPHALPLWIELRDTLLGPMAEAALDTLLKNQQAFLGRGFAADTAVGAVTSALLKVAAGGPLTATFDKDGLVRLYKAALDVAVTNPRLFVTGAGPNADLARDMLVQIGKAVQSAPARLSEGLAADIAVAALGAVQSNIPMLLRADGDAWRGAAAALIDNVLGGFADGLAKGAAGAAFERLFSRDEALALLAVFMRRVARTPGMITGENADKEVQALVGAFASAMGKNGAALLSAEGWIAVAEAVAAEAARNPLRLIRIGESPERQLLASVLSTVLTAAEAGLPGGRRGAGSLLFGETLEQAVIAAIQAAAGRSGKAAAHLADLRDFLALLNTVATTQPDRIGASEWMRLFRSHVGKVLDAGLAGTGVTADSLLRELET